MKKEDVKRKKINLEKFVLRKDIIDLGEYVLRKNLGVGWDFYQKKESRNNLVRYTHDEFIPQKIIGDAVYVSKKINGKIEQAIYGMDGKIKIDFLDTCIDCGESFLVEKHLPYGWDFYTKEGEQLTNQNFIGADLNEEFVKVYKPAFFDKVFYGLYGKEGKEIIPVDWMKLNVVESKLTGKPAYVRVEDYKGNLGIYNLDGSFILSPGKVNMISKMERNSKEYIKLRDISGREELYEFADNGLISEEGYAVS